MRREPAMTVQEGLADTGADAPALETPNSPDWWQSRSTDELQAIIQRGIQGGETFLAAATEMERRARVTNAALRDEEVHDVQDHRRLKKMALIALLVLPVAVAAVTRLEGLW
jgi:hypothetical protein